MCGSRGGQGVLAILVHIPLKVTKPPSQHSMLDHHQHNEIPAMTLQDIKETKRYGRRDRRMDGWTKCKQYTLHKQPSTNKVCGVSLLKKTACEQISYFWKILPLTNTASLINSLNINNEFILSPLKFMLF